MEAFKTNKTLREDNAALKANLTDLENNASELHDNHEAAKASIIEKDQAIATLQADNSKLVEDCVKHVADLEASQADLVEAQDAIVKAEGSAVAKAKDIAASAGHETKVDVQSEADSKSCSREEFFKKSASEQSAFSIAGGVIKN